MSLHRSALTSPIVIGVVDSSEIRDSRIPYRPGALRCVTTIEKHRIRVTFTHPHSKQSRHRSPPRVVPTIDGGWIDQPATPTVHHSEGSISPRPQLFTLGGSISPSPPTVHTRWNSSSLSRDDLPDPCAPRRDATAKRNARDEGPASGCATKLRNPFILTVALSPKTIR